MHGFLVKSRDALPDADGTLWQMEYVRNGARLIWMERPDENRTFAITFRTLPSDDTGVAHIMEHSVLGGSEKFPVKEPFLELLKSSMSTFLNAMTGSDYTCYPVASKNDRDFLNLAEVYLDAVFHPLSVRDDTALLQEGWHYEYDGTNLTRNGIVLSEMKACFGSPDRIGFRELTARLYPDNAYGRCSGGDPLHIPELTFEKYKAFYGRFYHPSNASIFLDGSVDLDATLALLDTYLAPFERRAETFMPVPQTPVSRTGTCRYECPEEARKTMLWDGWVVGRAPDCERDLALDAITDVLADSNEAPLKRALLDAGLCKDVEFGSFAHQQQTVYLVVRNTDPDKAAACRNLARSTLEKACRDGLDAKRLAAILDRKEFNRREVTDGQRGLHTLHTIRNAWLNGGDPVAPLRTTEIFARLRARLGTGWYERLLREAVLDNPHHAEVTLLPSKTVARERQEAERAELARIRADLSADELDRTVAAAKDLKARQSAPDRPEDIDRLPRLSIRDVPADGHLPEYAVETEAGTTVLRPRVNAGGIVYLDFCFSLAGLADEELLDVPFLAQALGKVATQRLSALDLKAEMDSRLGRFSVNASSYRRGPQLVLHAAALAARRDDALRLVGETALATRFDDTNAIVKLRRQLREDLERTARAHGLGFASQSVRRTLSPADRISELFSGMSQLRRLQNVESVDLAALARKIFTRSRLTLSLTGDLPHDFVRRAVAAWPAAATDARSATARAPSPRPPRSEGYEADGTVGFTAMAARLPSDRPFSGAHLVAARLASLEYIWPEIRAKGGAYGGRLSIDRDGIVEFGSWSDPNPARSFDTYAGTGRALAAFVKAGNSLEKYQVSTLAKTDPARAPRQEAGWIRSLYFDGRTADDLRRERREILSTTPAEMLAIADALTAVTTNAVRCAFAKRSLLEPCKFEKIEAISK